jgi:dephospho-CoA kinase
MKVIGLTGSIGMGKSTVAKMFAEEGAPFFDSDAAVHALYAPGGEAVAAIEAAFPGVTRNGGIDRAALSARVLGDGDAMRTLETIVHPLVGEARAAFVKAQRAAGVATVVLDIPLLLESGAPRGVDAVVVVSAPPEVQRARVLARPGMSMEKFESILARQLPDPEKRALADFVIDTGCEPEDTGAQVRAVLDALSKRV